MWDDVIIGSGEHLSSFVILFTGQDTQIRISENQSSYWIKNLILGAEMTIYKNTPEAKKLSKLLKDVKTDGKTEYVISDFLNRAFLKHIDPSKLSILITDATTRAFVQGQEAKLIEIQKVLGI